MYGILLVAVLAATPVASAWPGFRGHGDSLSGDANLPLTWSQTENVAWRTPLEGYGQSSPVVWGDKAFVTSIRGPEKKELLVAAVDVASGKVLWRREFTGAQGVEDSDHVSKAAPTPVVDQQRVYAFFESGNVIALDHMGETVWQRNLIEDYGEFGGQHGVGSSLAQTRDAVIVLVDHDGPSYLVALDKATGQTRWKVDHDKRVSWTTPLVVDHDPSDKSGTQDVIVSSNGFVEAFRGEDGSRLWSFDAIKGNTVASATAAPDGIIAGSSEPSLTCLLKRDPELGADQRVVWRTKDATVSFSSPLVFGPYVYTTNKAGVISCLNLSDGKTNKTLRLPDSCWASPVGVGERIYFFSKGGSTTVLKAGPDLEKLAENQLDIGEGNRVYGVAIIDSRILLRTGRELICVRQNSSTTAATSSIPQVTNPSN